MKISLFLLSILLSVSAFAQKSVPKYLVKHLEGTWIMDSEPKDKIVWRNANNVELIAKGDFVHSNLPVYSAVIIGDSIVEMHWIASSDSRAPKRCFKIDTINKVLIIQDFYRNTNEKFEYHKVEKSNTHE